MNIHEGIRWVFDSTDSRAHALVNPAPPETLVTVCGREFPADRTPTYGVPPSIRVCPTCKPSEDFEPPPAVFPTFHYY
ncbi:MAG: hypothetical protein ACRDRL_21620 [Sciscionella sp.]